MEILLVYLCYHYCILLVTLIQIIIKSIIYSIDTKGCAMWHCNPNAQCSVAPLVHRFLKKSVHATGNHHIILLAEIHLAPRSILCQ